VLVSVAGDGALPGQGVALQCTQVVFSLLYVCRARGCTCL